jgi:hypothetical protein
MSFKIGDVCVIVQSMHGNIGAECTIVAMAPDAIIADGNDCLISVHGVPSDHPTGLWSKRFAHLRKKPPPANYDGNQAGDWELCPFQPYRQKERV